MSTTATSKPRRSDSPTPPGPRETVVGHLVGLMLTAGGAAMLVCGAVDKITGGSHAIALVAPGLLFGLPGLLLWRMTNAPRHIGAPTVYGAILVGWAMFCVAAAVPYLASGVVHSFDLALFEAVSGFTTTASTVIHPLDGVSKGILLWRSTTQWFGGMAITVFVVSVLPYFRTAGFEHLAGISGGWGGERLASRVSETAKRLMLVYATFTAIVAALYALFGMSIFDAVAHAFSTVSTGGFSTHDASLAFFHSPAIEWTAIGAMILAGGNFALYWQALRGKPFTLFRSVELRAYLIMVAIVALAAVAWQTPHGGEAAVRRTLFGAVSISTTTGFTLVNYARWAGAVQLLLLFAMAVGGMVGSAAGGFKTFRVLAVIGHIRRHLFRQLHPRAVNIVRIGGDVIPDHVISRILGFFGLFMAVGAVSTFLVAAIGSLDLVSSISLVATSLGNVGPALGSVRHVFDIKAGARDVLIVVMLAGRLEIYPVLLGLVPFARFIADRLPPRAAQALIRAGRG